MTHPELQEEMISTLEGLAKLREGLRAIAAECGYSSIPTDALSIEMILHWVANVKIDIAFYKRSLSALETQNSRLCAQLDQMATIARGLVDQNERMGAETSGKSTDLC